MTSSGNIKRIHRNISKCFQLPANPTAFMRRTIKAIAIATTFVAVVGQMQAQAESWSESGSGAVAQLPEPQRSKWIVGAELSCEQQEWSLRLALASGTPGETGPRKARIAIGTENFDLDAERTALSVVVEIPAMVLPPLRQGLQMTVEIEGGAEPHGARFSLIGSRRTIEAVAPRCTKRDMSGYQPITLSEFNPETALARELLATEIKDFRRATKSSPAVAAVMVDLGEERRLLFATLCGSSWYYGNSGCNMTIHAQDGVGAWARVYETEGVSMYLDPAPTQSSWPNLVVLTFDGEEIRWHWEDGEYLPPADDETVGD